jgi:CDGSH-type Zn-finger protein
MSARDRAAHTGGCARITPYRDGPLLVRGDFLLTDQDGNEIAPGRDTVALCRCGKSRTRPFCDGTHRLVRFQAPSGREQGREGADPA